MSGAEHTTKQGRLIAACLEKHASVHLTAEEISQCLKSEGTVVSTATIYRHLEKLTANGVVRKYLSSPDEPACYQYNGAKAACVRHFHLKCTGCGQLFHVSCPYLEKLEEHIQEHHGFVIDNTRTVLYGLCRKCAPDT